MCHYRRNLVRDSQRPSLSEHKLGLVAVRRAVAGGAEIEVVAVRDLGLEEFDPRWLVDDSEHLIAGESDLPERWAGFLQRHC